MIARIKNLWLRRVTLLFMVPPIMLIIMAGEVLVLISKFVHTAKRFKWIATIETADRIDEIWRDK